jgi:hypothetical protein
MSFHFSYRLRTSRGGLANCRSSRRCSNSSHTYQVCPCHLWDVKFVMSSSSITSLGVDRQPDLRSQPRTGPHAPLLNLLTRHMIAAEFPALNRWIAARPARGCSPSAAMRTYTGRTWTRHPSARTALAGETPRGYDVHGCNSAAAMHANPRIITIDPRPRPAPVGHRRAAATDRPDRSAWNSAVRVATVTRFAATPPAAGGARIAWPRAPRRHRRRPRHQARSSTGPAAGRPAR